MEIRTLTIEGWSIHCFPHNGAVCIRALHRPTGSIVLAHGDNFQDALDLFVVLMTDLQDKTEKFCALAWEDLKNLYGDEKQKLN